MESLEILQKEFEGNGVGILIENNEPLFELYSTAMALGQVKKTTIKGKEYKICRKDRTDKNVENAEIKLLVRNGLTYLNEQMLYDLMLEIKTDKVKPFRKWVTGEVLPSIRKHGAYLTDEAIHNIKSDPEYIKTLLADLETEKAKNKLLEQKEEEYSVFLNSKDGIDMDIAANLLKFPKMGRTKLFAWLRDKKVLMDGERRNIPYAKYSKHFEVIVTTHKGHVTDKCLVKPSGLKLIKKLYKKEKELLSAVQ